MWMRLWSLGIRHVTITINAIDPEVGQAIYPWVFDEGVRYEGREAAELLIRRQLLGLEMLAKLGILVKVNSIMIPGVNDHHLTAVSARVKELGATLHNVTPLIIAPGSQYEADGRKAPRPKELLNLQEQLGRGGMKVMRHCRQCRADAIGLLGQDRNPDFPLEAMEAEPVINEEARAMFQRGGHQDPRARLGQTGQTHSGRRAEDTGRGCHQRRRQGESAFRSCH